MATVKIKFRPSTVGGGQGSIFYQVIHNRVIRQQKTGYRLYSHEWNRCLSEVVLPQFNENRKHYLLEIGDKIRMDIKQISKIISDYDHCGCNYTADDVIADFASKNPEYFLSPFVEGVIANLKVLGKIRTSETYATTIRSFIRFRKGRDVALSDMDSDMMMAYEAYLLNNGICLNSVSFYMRNLRALYNRAVERGLTLQQYPFKHVYTGVDKTLKRAVPLRIIKKIKEMDFSEKAIFDFARDMFLFSFYTRGMSFVDMAYLRKKDLQNGFLSYRRRKTGQQLFIKWEECMQKIVDKYDTSQSSYLLPVIKPFVDINERRQYIYAAHKINRCLKIIGKELNLSMPLTLYVARHAWASIAKSKNVPLSVISEGMGHDSESTTRIYLASLDSIAIDKANRMILNSL
ncbi:MAG: site-specific integrase [Bacteroidaceae bacterium]|nr:site-specific integrase [Bacteroidaceae bacterium]